MKKVNYYSQNLERMSIGIKDMPNGKREILIKTNLMKLKSLAEQYIIAQGMLSKIISSIKAGGTIF